MYVPATGALRCEPAVAGGGRRLAADPDPAREGGAAADRDGGPRPVRRLQQHRHQEGLALW